jgi:hypothetical protein
MGSRYRHLVMHLAACEGQSRKFRTGLLSGPVSGHWSILVHNAVGEEFLSDFSTPLNPGSLVGFLTPRFAGKRPCSSTRNVMVRNVKQQSSAATPSFFSF